MPELPDVTVYCEALAARVTGATLEACAAALRGAGAIAVQALVVAREA